MCKGLWYWLVRRFLRRVSRLTKQQCSGKRRVGPYSAVEWCQELAFHDGPCVSFGGDVFTKTDK